MAVFTLIEGTHHVELDVDGQAKLSVTVSNETADEIRARIALLPASADTDRAWLEVQGNSECAIRGNGSAAFSALVKVPEGTPPGQYAVRWRVQSVRNPDREHLDGEPISFAVRPREAVPAPPAKSFPLWIPLSALGVIAVATSVFLLWPTYEIPRLVGMTVDEASSKLAADGWVAVPAGEFDSEGVVAGRISKQVPVPGDVPSELEEIREVQYWIQPAAPVAAAPASTCVELVQNKIAWNYTGGKTWAKANLERLCAGAEGSNEPPACFRRIMHGGVSWGGGTRWNWKNALDLCEGTRNASATVACFEAEIKRGVAWSKAVRTCEQG